MNVGKGMCFLGKDGRFWAIFDKNIKKLIKHLVNYQITYTFASET